MASYGSVVAQVLPDPDHSRTGVLWHISRSRDPRTKTNFGEARSTIPPVTQAFGRFLREANIRSHSATATSSFISAGAVASSSPV